MVKNVRSSALRVEALEQRLALSVSAMADDVATTIGPTTDGPIDVRVADAGFLAPVGSREYLEAGMRLRRELGWVVNEPVLLPNGNWYAGPSGQMGEVNELFNLNAADTVNADQVWAGGGLGLNLTGAGVTVGVWDGGPVLATHNELAGRVTVIDAGGASNHATHVAGTIGATGVNAAARGLASGVGIRSYDLTNDVAEMSGAATQVTVSNHSYGLRVGWTVADLLDGLGNRDRWWDNRSLHTEDPDFGKYTTATQSLDAMLFGSRFFTSVWAAGNDRGEGFLNIGQDGYYATTFTADPGGTRWYFNGSTLVQGWNNAGTYLVPFTGNPNSSGPPVDGVSNYDMLPPMQVAKNGIVVGSVGDITADPYTGAAISAFSSIGPTDDGRIKPDLVANGEVLISSLATANNAYSTTTPGALTTYSGTSMAAPGVTGAAALLVQHYRNLYQNQTPWSTTLKSLLIHTATDAGTVGPDYAYGWGVVNTANAAQFLTNSSSTDPTRWLFQEEFRWKQASEQNEFVRYVYSNGTAPLKATLAWLDPAATTLPGSGLDDATSVLVRNLDLTITGPSGAVSYPWTLNPNLPGLAAVRTTANNRDNVEQVLIDAPTQGLYTIRVRYGGPSTDGVFLVPMSLVVDGGLVTSPPRVVMVEIDGAGNANAPYSIPSGSGDQLRSVAVGGANQVRISFNEPIQTTNLASALTINGITIHPYTTTFAYDSYNYSATWTLPSGTYPNGFSYTDAGSTVHPFADKLLLTLDDAKVLDRVSNMLDGEWTNPDYITQVSSSISRFPSGTGTAGGDFVFRVIVINGEFTQDNVVDLNDFGVYKDNFGVGTTYLQGDANGSGLVDLGDKGIHQTNFGISWANWNNQQMLMAGGGGGDPEVMTQAERDALGAWMEAELRSFVRKRLHNDPDYRLAFLRRNSLDFFWEWYGDHTKKEEAEILELLATGGV